MQQAGGDELVARVALLGEVGRLQRVLELRHRLAAVLGAAVAGEEQLDVFEGQHGGLSLTRVASSAGPSAANCDWRMRVAVSAPADSRMG